MLKLLKLVLAKRRHLLRLMVEKKELPPRPPPSCFIIFLLFINNVSILSARSYNFFLAKGNPALPRPRRVSDIEEVLERVFASGGRENAISENGKSLHTTDVHSNGL